MFYYYGAKNMLAKHYPPPKLDLVIEPFGGSAAYGIHHLAKNNKLRLIVNEKDPKVFNMWAFLKNTTFSEIENYPLPNVGENTSDFFIMTCAASNAVSKCSKMKVSERLRYVFEIQKRRILQRFHLLERIEVTNLDYTEIINQQACWFIDPPYQLQTIVQNTPFQNGNGYSVGYNSDSINFSDLASWCISRDGQIIVCEKQGANWLPFRSFRTAKNGLNTIYDEVVFTT